MTTQKRYPIVFKDKIHRPRYNSATLITPPRSVRMPGVGEVVFEGCLEWTGQDGTAMEIDGIDKIDLIRCKNRIRGLRIRNGRLFPLVKQ